MLRFDNKLIRSVAEANGFAPTESHEWNILWSSSSCKSYLYEGLNEYQKINHFPQSHEITRKDRFETLEEISKIIGTYDDFCLTSLFLQNKEKNF